MEAIDNDFFVFIDLIVTRTNSFEWVANLIDSTNRKSARWTAARINWSDKMAGEENLHICSQIKLRLIIFFSFSQFHWALMKKLCMNYGLCSISQRSNERQKEIFLIRFRVNLSRTEQKWIEDDFTGFFLYVPVKFSWIAFDPSAKKDRQAWNQKLMRSVTVLFLLFVWTETSLVVVIKSNESRCFIHFLNFLRSLDWTWGMKNIYFCYSLLYQSCYVASHFTSEWTDNYLNSQSFKIVFNHSHFFSNSFKLQSVFFE